jgi:tRNA pseudouridine55 synthase
MNSQKRKPRGRDINGILLLDKPSGITSNDALQIVKRMYNASKAGHTGSLDRPATGMLPICFGEATKFTSYLLNADKHYMAQGRLGVTTTTGDADGEITATQAVPESLSASDIRRILEQFKGEILQVPPMHSALKHKGQRLYTLAYQGIEVEREPRPVTIYDIELTDFTPPQFGIKVHCSKGTYIRTLVEDIGKQAGCGAHITSLVRTAVGPFKQGMVSQADLARLSAEGFEALDSQLLPIDAVIQDLPEITLSGPVSRYLGQGQPVIVPHAPTTGMLRLYDQEHRFLGVAEVLDDGRIAPRRLVSVGQP